MRIRTVAAAAVAAGLALSVGACGKSGSPGGGGKAGIEPPPKMQVAKNVTVNGSPTFNRIKQRGQLVIGVKDDQPGLGQQDPTTGKYSGFDIDVALYLAGKLGYSADQVKYQPVASGSRESAVSGGQVDYYVGTYTINDKRKHQVGFAGPYFVAGQDLLIRQEDKGKITGPQSLKGKNVCSVTGSTPIQNVRERKLTNNITELQKYSDCVTKLENKQVDAVTTDDAILKGYAAQSPKKFTVVGKTFSEEPYGVGLARNDKVMRDKFNDYLQQMLDDGSWKKFYDQTLGKSGTPAPAKPKIERY